MEIKVITRTFNFILQFINLNHFFQADYTIVYLTDTVAVEYDCSSFLGLFTNYCIHILSRTPNISTEDEAAAISYAESLGLNTQNLPFHKTLQAGCWWLYRDIIILDFFFTDIENTHANLYEKQLHNNIYLYFKLSCTCIHL